MGTGVAALGIFSASIAAQAFFKITRRSTLFAQSEFHIFVAMTPELEKKAFRLCLSHSNHEHTPGLWALFSHLSWPESFVVDIAPM